MKRYIMFIDASTQGINEKPIICLGDTIDELAQEFEQKSIYYFLDNVTLNGANYSPSDIAVVFDMENDNGYPMMIERILTLTKI